MRRCANAFLPERSAKEYVLADFDQGEKKALSELFSRGLEGLELWIKGDPQKSARVLNTEG